MSKEMLKNTTSILPGFVITEEDKQKLEFSNDYSKLKRFVKNPKNKQSKKYEEKYKTFLEVSKKIGGYAWFKTRFYYQLLCLRYLNKRN